MTQRESVEVWVHLTPPRRGSCSGVSMSARIMHRSASALALAAAWLLAVSATPVCGIYVSTTSGIDSPSCGLSAATPCQTINHGIARAAALVVHWVNVQAGTYNETVHMAGGVSIDGGYDASWVRGGWGTPANQGRIIGGFDARGGQFITIVAHDLTAPARLSNLIVTGANASGTSGGNGLSSYAIHVRSSRLFITDVRVEAGNGAPGAAGTNGADASASAAQSGGTGGNGAQPGGACNSTSHGAGGSAGTNGCAGTVNSSGGAG